MARVVSVEGNLKTIGVMAPHFSIPLLTNGVPVAPMLVGSALHLAKGFGKRPSSSSSPLSPSEKEEMRSIKSMRGKVIPCEECGGTGKRPCQFCQGTKLMVGFLGQRVPCVPCEATGTLGRICQRCDGAGFMMP